MVITPLNPKVVHSARAPDSYCPWGPLISSSSFETRCPLGPLISSSSFETSSPYVRRKLIGTTQETIKKHRRQVVSVIVKRWKFYPTKCGADARDDE